MKQRILAVDDELYMLKLLERIITEKTPYEILITNNSLEVPGLLEQSAFNLIITDLKMPGLDGIDLLRWVKDKGRSEEVIIITAFGSLESALAAFSLGAFDYITKPFKGERIIGSADRAMQGQSLKREGMRMRELLGREPFEEARRAFAEEYLHGLAKRCGGDPEVMTQRSGLPPELIAGNLKPPARNL